MYIKRIESNFCAVLLACLSPDTIDIRSNRSKKIIDSPLAYLTDVLTTVFQTKKFVMRRLISNWTSCQRVGQRVIYNWVCVRLFSCK